MNHVSASLRMCALVSSYCIADSLVRFQALNEPSLTVLGRGDRTALSLTASGGMRAVQFRITGTYQDEVGLLQLPGFEVDPVSGALRPSPRRVDAAPAPLPDVGRLEQHYGEPQPDDRREPADLAQPVGPAAHDARTAGERDVGDVCRYHQWRVLPTEPQRRVRVGWPCAAATLLTDYYTRQTASTLTLTQGINAQWRPRAWFNASAQAGVNVIPRHDALLLPLASSKLPWSPILVGSCREVSAARCRATSTCKGTLRKPVGMGFLFLTNVGANRHDR